MSFFIRSVLPIGFAIGFGIWNGYYAFNPVLKEQMEKKKNDPALNDAIKKSESNPPSNPVSQ